MSSLGSNERNVIMYLIASAFKTGSSFTVKESTYLHNIIVCPKLSNNCTELDNFLFLCYLLSQQDFYKRYLKKKRYNHKTIIKNIIKLSKVKY